MVIINSESIQGMPVTKKTILVVESDPMLRCSIMAAVELADYALIGLDGEESALDWLWEGGSNVAAVFVDRAETLLTGSESLLTVLKRDWPEILVVVSQSRSNTAAVEGSGVDLLNHPWTPLDVAQKLMSASVQHAA